MRKTLIRRPRIEGNVYGLRDYGSPGEVRTFKVNPDGSKGELVKITPPDDFDPVFSQRFNYKTKRLDR